MHRYQDPVGLHAYQAEFLETITKPSSAGCTLGRFRQDRECALRPELIRYQSADNVRHRFQKRLLAPCLKTWLSSPSDARYGINAAMGLRHQQHLTILVDTSSFAQHGTPFLDAAS